MPSCVNDEMVTAAMREFEKYASRLLRYREADRWHLNDVLGMREAIKAALGTRCSVTEFAKAILHGDAAHREWLLEAAAAFTAGRPIPPPRSGLPPINSSQHTPEAIGGLQRRALGPDGPGRETD